MACLLSVAQTAQAAGIGYALSRVAVAKYAANGQQVELVFRRAHRQHQGARVIEAQVGVDDKFLRHSQCLLPFVTYALADGVAAMSTLLPHCSLFTSNRMIAANLIVSFRHL